MWLEGDGDCFRANHPRAAHDFTENMRMRPMDAIEVADAHDGASEVGRYVIELVEDIHSKSLTAKFAKASQRTQRTSLRPLRSEEHTSELQSPVHLVCCLLLEKKYAEQI